MKLIVGLGNPGEKYKNTRHNAGFMFIDRLGGIHRKAISRRFGGKEVLFLKPHLFMNKSGVMVKKYLKKYAGDWKGAFLPFLWVVHDDLDIKLGEYKISFGKGPKTHNGLKSIYEQIENRNFWHVRIGIKRQSSELSASSELKKRQSSELSASSELKKRQSSELSGKEYVLGKWKPEEREIINQVIDKIRKELKDVFA